MIDTVFSMEHSSLQGPEESPAIPILPSCVFRKMGEQGYSQEKTDVFLRGFFPWPDPPLGGGGRARLERRGSFAEQIKDERQQQADQDHGTKGDIELEIGAVDEDVSGQSSEGELAQPGPEEPDEDHDNSDGDEGSLHGFDLSAGLPEAPERFKGASHV
jgi:hypothetical protein